VSTALVRVPPLGDVSTWGDRKLDNAIQRGHATAGAHMSSYEEAATLTGLLLIERRRRLRSRAFAPWLAEHFDGARKTAYRYIDLAEAYLASVSRVTQIDPPAEAPGDELEVVDGEVVDDDDVTPPPAPPKRKRKPEPTLEDYLPDMLPGAQPEGEFRQQVVAWCDQERRLTAAIEGTGIALVPKSEDDRRALLAALAAVRELAMTFEEELTDGFQEAAA
jgi:hypothetical protein